MTPPWHCKRSWIHPVMRDLTFCNLMRSFRSTQTGRTASPLSNWWSLTLVVHHLISVSTGPMESIRSIIATIIINKMTRAARIHQAKRRAKRRVIKEQSQSSLTLMILKPIPQMPSTTNLTMSSVEDLESTQYPTKRAVSTSQPLLTISQSPNQSRFLHRLKRRQNLKRIVLKGQNQSQQSSKRHLLLTNPLPLRLQSKSHRVKLRNQAKRLKNKI